MEQNKNMKIQNETWRVMIRQKKQLQDIIRHPSFSVVRRGIIYNNDIKTPRYIHEIVYDNIYQHPHLKK